MTTQKTGRPHRSTTASLVLLTMIATHAVGQKQPPLPTDDPELYYSFFFFMEDFGEWLDMRAVQASDRQAALTASAARYLKVDVDDLPALISSCQSTAADLRIISNDARQYWVSESAKGRHPDPASLRSFEAKRQTAIQDGIDRLQRTLSKSSWTGIHSHINGTHRAMMRRSN